MEVMVVGDELPEIIWMRPERPARGPVPAHSRARITEVALEIADAEGLEALSMRRVAKELGAGTMSLYRYVPSKDDLIELMVDAVIGEFIPEEGDLSGDWRTDLRLVAHHTRRAMRRHPWIAGRPGGMTFGPNALQVAEVALGAVDGLGLTIDQMMSVTGMVTSYVNGFVQNELMAAEVRRRTGLTDEQLMLANAPYIRSIMETGKHPLVERVIMDARQPHMDPGERFEYGLESILDGIAGSLP
jgi:AcrR family transcriptional regulator